MNDINIQISNNFIYKATLIDSTIRFSSITRGNIKEIPTLVYQYRSNPAIESKEIVKIKNNPYSVCPLLDISELPKEKEEEISFKLQSIDINSFKKEKK